MNVPEVRVKRVKRENAKPRAKSDKPRSVTIEYITEEMFKRLAGESVNADLERLNADFAAAKYDFKNATTEEEEAFALSTIANLALQITAIKDARSKSYGDNIRRVRRMIWCHAKHNNKEILSNIFSDLAKYFPTGADVADFWKVMETETE